jgi:GT2 family glycosyltransferase
VAVSEHPSVSVVVPTYNGAGLLERILRPLLDDPAASEVIVVVDGCRDGSVELVDRLAENEPRLRSLFIENSGDMGAREAGAHAASSEILLFIDDDVLADPGLVTGHARRHAENVADIVVGYMPVRSTRRRSPGDFAVREYSRVYEGRCDVYDTDPRSPVRDLWGGNFSMRRARALTVGMTNPSFTEHYHADRDFGIRCFEAGLSGTFDRSLSAVHLHERTLESFVRDAQSQGAAFVLLPRFHPDTVPAPASGEFARNVPRPLSDLVHLSRRPRGYRAVSGALRLMIRITGSARVWPVQDQLGRLLRRVEQQHGAIRQATHGKRMAR